MSLGRELRHARIDAGHDDEAAFSDMLGISVATLRAWEADIQRPGDEDVEQFAQATGMDPNALSHLAHDDAPQGICRAVDLVPD
jgi:transcriptional regulator with XRE-family HTH domain